MAGIWGTTSIAKLAAAALALTISAAASAQTATAPAIDSDLVGHAAPATPAPASPTYVDPLAQPGYAAAQPDPSVPTPMVNPTIQGCATARAGQTYHQDDMIYAAEKVFGSGAQGLAVMIRDILAKQGEPNGYIAGREASGAIGIGLRYGSGLLCSQALGKSAVYWTGPSLGFDFGASAAKTLVLVYNLTKPEDLYRRFAAGEGQAYLVGGFHVSYLRHGNVVLIPVRMGVGLRLGINGGYMKITRKLNYLPF